MNNKENVNCPIKMYWQDVPREEDKIKNVLPTGTYCEPGNIINSTHVHVEGKPWLQKTKLKKKENKAPPQIKQTISKSKINNNANGKTNEINQKNKNDKTNKHVTTVDDKNEERIDDNPNNYLQGTTCSLAELRKEDKQRVAALVREMAKFSEEKEMAVQELHNLKTNFTVKLKSLESEKQKMIKEQDTLKEKLLRYELILTEIKDKQKIGGSNQNSVEAILKNHISLQELSTDFQGYEKVTTVNYEKPPEKFPGNLRSTKHSNGEGNVAENFSEDHLKDVNEFADLFFKQQDKFHQQQEILQRQIEQLQKLQESILEQQQQHLKEIQVDSETCGNQVKQKKETSCGNQVQQKKETSCGNQVQQKNETSCGIQVQQKNETSCGIQVQQNDLHENPFDESSKGRYSVKLQNYISKQSKYGNNAMVSTELNKENMLRKVNSPSHILASDTLMDDDSENNILVSVHCLNATTKSSKVDSVVQTKDNVSIQTDAVVTESNRAAIKSKEDVCLQTDVMVSKDVPVSTNKANMCIGTDNVNYLTNQHEMNRLELCNSHISKLEESLKNMSSNKLVHKTNIDTHTNGKLKVDKDKKFTTELSTHKEIRMIDDNYDHDIDDDTQEAGKKNTSVTSALQRGHFQPASILELIDGLQPPSTSTSIDQHSFKKISFINPTLPTNRQISRRTPLSPSNRQVKSKVKNERGTTLQKVYGRLNVKQNGGIIKQRQERSLEDQEEQKMLADVFFVR